MKRNLRTFYLITITQVLSLIGSRMTGLAIGIRASEWALAEMGKSGDEELVAVVETDMCGVDAVQYLTGCTFGKGNLRFHDYGKQIYTVYSRVSRKGVRVLFHGNGIPEKLREDRDALADWILAAPADSIVSVSPVSIQEPEPARIMKSIPCAFCGESVMVSRIREIDGQTCCIPCYKQNAG